MGRIAYVNKDETHINGEFINNATIPDEDIKIVQKEMDECPGECIKWKK